MIYHDVMTQQKVQAKKQQQGAPRSSGKKHMTQKRGPTIKLVEVG